MSRVRISRRAPSSSRARPDRVRDGEAVPFARGFPPVSSPDAHVLVLGSLPGEASIAARQYYAQPRNAFWPIMGELVGAAPHLDYAERLERLRASGIALWDVLAAGERRGSLDSSIVPSTMIINDFRTFFATHRRIRFVAFNGTMASELFRRRVLPTLPPEIAAFESARLPSTSPANASYSYARKLEAWRAVLGPYLAGR